MGFDFKLPDLGEGITEAEIAEWKVKEGDIVAEHQAVLEVETDKALSDIPAPRAGRVAKIHREKGEIVRVGETLMTIAEEGEVLPEALRPKSVSVVGVLPEAEEVLATPSVRALAREHGVELSGVRGSGPGGSVTTDDVLHAVEKTKRSQRDAFGSVERQPLKGLRRTIARNLVTAQKTAAFVTGMDEADITELWDLRERENGKLSETSRHLTFLPFVIKAVQHSLAAHRRLNASLDEEKQEIILKGYYNFGIAVDTPEGLLVPVIREVDSKTILALSDEIRSLSGKARSRTISIEEMKGSTFTITNYGHFGGWFATPIINYPDVAILGTGRISEKPWVKDGTIVIRKILPLSLTFDHRVTDGVDAARFLTKVIGYLEDPARLFIESA